MEKGVRFKSKAAIVTGAASGIGRATARRLAEEGAAVAVVDRDGEALGTLVAELTAEGRAAAAWTVDVGDEAAVATCVAQVAERFGRVDVLCNNAGVACGRELMTEQDMAAWDRVLRINLLGVVHFTMHAARVMRDSETGGSIVNTASVAGIRSGAGGNAYSASKAAVLNLTQTSACDLAQWNIRVNAVCPGLIETGMTKQIFEHARAIGKEEKLGARCEMRRAGRPEEVASVIAFLASDDASYVTGQALPVDGGNTASLNLPGMKV